MIPSRNLSLLLTALLAPLAAAQDELLPGPGWRWELEPRELPDDWPERGFSRFVPSGSVSLFATAGGQLVVQRAQTVDLELDGAAELQFKPVLVDREGKALRIGGSMTFARPDLKVATTYSEASAGDVARFGLAVLDLEGRKEAAAAAAREAEELGASILPLPLVGEPFVFELPTLDGGTVRSEDLRGKVVLLDCWATW